MDYLSIRVSTLRGDQKIAFNVFVKINDKYIMYLKQGDSFEGQRLQRLKEKKLKKMFILPEDEKLYRSYIKQNIEQAYDPKSTKSTSSRAEIIQGDQQSKAESVLEAPESEQNYQEAKSSADQYAQFLLKNTQMIKAILSLENSDKSIAHHGVSVSTLSLALAQRMKINEQFLSLLGLGALLHDIGHLESSVDYKKALSQMSPDELLKYQMHVEQGAQKVIDKKHFDQQVVKIINEHEELINGKGYPKGTSEKLQDPLSVIVSSANAADRMISFEGVPQKEAGRKLLIDKIGQHPLEHLKILAEILK